MPETRIVLASASPRRKEILAAAGLTFEIAPAEVDESLDLRKEPRLLARLISKRKAAAAAAEYRDAIIIAADTFIAFHGHLLGKPHTGPEARRMLKLLSNKTHSVITGYTILDTRTGRSVSSAEETRVTFYRLTDAEIRRYVETGEPLDKAGAYAIQGRGAMFVRKIEGDYLNVVGLPLAAVVRKLRRFGVSVF